MRRSVGETIRELRDDNEIKQYDLASKLGVANNTLSQYESGTRTPDLETADRIATKFNVSLDYLCGIHDIKYNPRDNDFSSLMKVFVTCSEEQKKKIIKVAKNIQKEGL